ncbi:hypothetical protein AGOR_G00240100 [Albula goreensis]|uniref:Ig-like domain-containing protein n=1 Tax=Albula goreensis TaxID=1534307 RepID=A0A8T3CIN2_9TELE|nr:hypothetical protein AGOR_G00240100 [Albula goreensis]
MQLFTGLVLMVFFCFSTEEVNVMNMTEGQQASMKCTFVTESSNSYLFFWYRQYPGSSPQFILYRGAGNHTADFAKERFESTADERRVMVGGSFEDSINSLNSTVYASEGSSVILSCNYTTTYSTGSNYLHWYRQYPRSKPEFIILIIESKGNDTKDRFTVIPDKESKNVRLEISSAEVTDSALYYCALQPTVTGNP